MFHWINWIKLNKKEFLFCYFGIIVLCIDDKINIHLFRLVLSAPSISTHFQFLSFYCAVCLFHLPSSFSVFTSSLFSAKQVLAAAEYTIVYYSWSFETFFFILASLLRVRMLKYFSSTAARFYHRRNVLLNKCLQ